MSIGITGEGSLISELLALINAIKVGALDVAWVLGLLWVIQMFNSSVGGRLCVLGIVPRNPLGMFGIFFAPILHGSFSHLFFNSVPLFLLLTFMMTYGLHTAICATLMITFFSGLATWLFGRKSIHVGASGLIMGYMGFILYSGYYGHSLSGMIVAIVSFYYLGSILFSVIPTDSRTSWEGHLFGLLAGLFSAAYGCLPIFSAISYHLTRL